LIAALVLALALLAGAPAAHAVPTATEQVPLEVEPAQGPIDSDFIVHATGWDPGEFVQVYVDGDLYDYTEADSGGSATMIVEAPAEVGRHPVILNGFTSHRTAGGVFRTTATGAEQVAFVASPRPMRLSGSDEYPYEVDYFVANFPADTAIEAFYYWEPENDYYVYPFGVADFRGRYETTETWKAGDFGVTDLAIGRPGSTEPLLASAALIAPTAGYTPQRRVRAIPSLARPDEPVFLVGSGFTPGGAVTLRELLGSGNVGETPAGDAAADGTVVAQDATGSWDQEYHLSQSDGYGATAVFRESTSVTPPTAAAALDLLDAGTTTRVVAVGLTPGPVTLTGRDASGATSTASATVTAAGTVDTTFAVPAAAVPGPYEIQVGAATATLSVKGGISPPRWDDGPNTVALPPGEGDAHPVYTLCNDRGVPVTVALSDDSDDVTTPSQVEIGAESCSQVTFTVDDEGNPGQQFVLVRATTTDGITNELGFARVLRAVTMDPIPTRALAGDNPPGDIHLTGSAEPNACVDVIGLPYGQEPERMGGTVADATGAWEVDPWWFPGPRGTHVRIVAVPCELSADGDLSRYEPAEGVLFLSRILHFDGSRTWTDFTTSTTVFRDVGEATEGVGDVFVLAPETSDDSFDGAAALEVSDAGGAAVAVTRQPDPSEEGALLPGDDLFLEREYDVGGDGVTLTRRSEVEGGSRSMTIVDTFANPTGVPRTFTVSVVTRDGRDADGQELRLSTGGDWLGDGEIPAEGAVLAEGGAVAAQGYVALRDEDPADAATSGHGFVAWRQAPQKVLTRASRRDLLVLEYAVTVPANGTRVLRHAIGATPTDASALATAAAAADTEAPALAVTSPAEGATVSSRDVLVEGTASDALGTPSVEVEGTAVSVAGDGTWSRQVTLSDGDGSKVIHVTAADGQGHTATVDRTVTLSRPPVVATGDAHDITQTGAAVDVDVNPNGNATTYAVEYGTASDELDETSSVSAPVSGTTPAAHTVTLTGLSPATTYYYRATATNSAGTRTGAVKTFTTDSPPGAAVPSALTASDVTTSSMKLSGTVDPNGSDTTWFVEYGPTTGYGSTTPVAGPLTGSSPVAVEATLTGLAPGTTYYARIVATNAAGPARRSSPDVFATLALPVAGAATASDVTATGALISGSVTPHGAGKAWVEYGTGGAFPSATAPIDVAGDAPVAVGVALDALAPSTAYAARLAVQRGDTIVRGDAVAFTTAAPPDDGDGDGDGGGSGGDGDGDGGGGGSGDGGGGSGDGGGGSGDGGGGTGTGTGGGSGDGGFGGGPGFLDPRRPVLPLPASTGPLKLRDVLKGVPLGFDLTGANCSPSCTLEVQVLLDGRTARRLRAAAVAKLVTVGATTRTYRAGGPVRMRVPLKPKARRGLKRAKRVTLVVRATLTDGAGVKTVAQRNVSVRR
jgi:hypothetical protein